MSPPWSTAIHFNPLSPHGERPRIHKLFANCFHFNPLSPHGERHPRQFLSMLIMLDFNPLSPHGERLHGAYKLHIHPDISIHSPRMGRDGPVRSARPWAVRFQSTLPAWGETMLLPTRPIDSKISIHSPRMGRDLKCLSHFLDFRHISIHSPRMGRDPMLLPTRPIDSKISIHSPRMGRDPTDTMGLRLYKDFNPLSPHGERRRGIGKWMKKAYISIHSPRMGRDRRARNQPKNRAYFNPLSPHGERLYMVT